MQLNELRRYIKNTEKRVVPADVAAVTQGSSFLRKLPLRLQQYIADRGSRSNPYMSFIVEPYATFLAFEILDTEAVGQLLPPGYSLMPAAMFTDTDPRLCAIVGAFNVRTDVFWGNRIEFYVVAQNCETNLLSWVIIDYETNTHSYEPSRGFIGPRVKHSVVTTSYAGEVIIDMVSAQTGNGLKFVAGLKSGVVQDLSQRLWVEGNLSVDYGGDLQQSTKPFSLVFDPGEMAQAMKLPIQDIHLCANTFGVGILNPAPFEVACFPYAQHFVTTSIPTATTMRTAGDLERAVKEINRQLHDPDEVENCGPDASPAVTPRR